MRVRESKYILIADDSDNSRIRMGNILLTGGHKVTLAKDERKVLGHLKDNSLRIDLLILDLQSSQINGFAVLEWIRDNDRVDNPHILLIVGTYDSSVILNELRELGAKDLLTKGMGVTPEHFFFRVNKILYGDGNDLRVPTRVLTDIPVELTCFSRALLGKILNLSCDGAFISTDEHFETRDILKMKFFISKEDKEFEIEAEGEVVWGDEFSEGQKLLNGLGVHFTKIGAEERTMIACFVEEEIRKVY